MTSWFASTHLGDLSTALHQRMIYQKVGDI